MGFGVICTNITPVEHNVPRHESASKETVAMARHSGGAQCLNPDDPDLRIFPISKINLRTRTLRCAIGSIGQSGSSGFRQ